MHVEPNWIVFWPSPACTELERVGGKAVGLSRLAALGAPVPEGFCVATDAYRAFVAANGLEPLVRATLASPAGDARRSAVAKLHDAFVAGQMPASIASAILQTYRALGANATVAVRSSATAEDLSTASFAGGQATFLGVCGDADLLRSIQRCWASLWNERVLAYRARMEITEVDLALAVVVQRLVKAQVSGVLFTRDPVSGRGDRLVVEACRGLGESLVSGQVTPEHWELDRDTLEVRLHRAAAQETMMSCAGDGVAIVTMPVELQERSCLDAETLHRLARIALAIEAASDTPQDIEWALDDDLHILQARPVTSRVVLAPGHNVQWESPVPRADWVRRSGGIVEYLSAPPSPLYATAQLPEVCRLLGVQFAAMSSKPRQPAYTLLNGYFYLRADYDLGLHLLLLPWRYWRAARRGARRWRQEILPAQCREIDSLRRFNVRASTDDALLEHVERCIGFNARAWDEAVRASRTYVFTEPLFRRLHAWLVRPLTGGDPVVLLRGFPSQALEGECVLSGLVRQALHRPAIRAVLESQPSTATLHQLESEAPDWMQALHRYCDTYGHASTSHDYLEPTAGDSPLEALRAIRMRLALPPSNPSVRLAAIQHQREMATAEAEARLAHQPLQRRLFRWILTWAQEGAASREDLFFHAFRGRPVVRRAMLELGHRLCARNALAKSEDVFFLEWQEVRAALSSLGIDRRAVVAERRALHASRCTLTPPPRVASEGTRSGLRRLATLAKRALVGRSKVMGDHILQGAPVSPGVVTGPARIVHTTRDLERLQTGDIMVARTATPEWTPSFAVVAGLITDVGGPLSHSSIIAREYGLPSVMGVQRATLAIAEGQMITLDGASGLIRLH